MIEDLRRSIDNVGALQRQMMRVTGTAWSPDRLVKAVVGPRGQLLELEIDPRVYRTPNSKALAATILATVRAAVEQVIVDGSELLDQALPRELGLDSASPLVRMARRHDAEVVKEAEEADE